MSASPIARQATHSQVIPSRRVLITDPSQMPDVYSSTPGGTVYSTTPGGTRIVYERSFMMSLRQSPISQTPPKCALPAALLKNPNSVPNVIQPTEAQKARSNSISFDESQETFSTRIVYERSFMMSLRQSPISQTPPKCALPAALLKNPNSVPNVIQPTEAQKARSNSISFDESQETFSMDL